MNIEWIDEQRRALELAFSKQISAQQPRMLDFDDVSKVERKLLGFESVLNADGVQSVKDFLSDREKIKSLELEIKELRRQLALRMLTYK